MITYVGERGVLQINTGTGASQDVTFASDCTTGNTIILIYVARRTSLGGESVTDSKGNTWTIDNIPSVISGNQWIIVASTRQDVGTLVTSDTVTITAGTSWSNARIAVLEEFSGLLISGYLDKIADQGQSGGSFTSFPTGTTAATDQADELAVAAWSINGDFADTPSLDGAFTGFTTSTNRQVGGDTFKRWYVGQYKILSSTGTQSAAVTKTTAESSSNGLITTYRAGGEKQTYYSYRRRAYR